MTTAEKHNLPSTSPGSRNGKEPVCPRSAQAASRHQVVAHKRATTVPTMPSVAGFTTFRQVKWAGSPIPTGAGPAP